MTLSTKQIALTIGACITLGAAIFGYMTYVEATKPTDR